MKKTLFALAALAALATACVKEQQPSDAPAGQGDVTVLKVSVAPTKVTIDEQTGACAWQGGDQLAVWYVSDEDATTGKKVIFTYDGLLEDGSAKFTANDEVTGYTAIRAAHPVNSLSAEGGLSLVREWTYDAERRPMYLITEDITTNQDGSLSAQLSHSASVFKFTLHDIPAYAAGFVLESKRYAAGEEVDKDGNKIDKGNVSQTLKITTKFPYKTGYTADPTDYTNDIVLYSVAAKNTYLSRIYLIDGDGDEIEGSEKKFKQSWNNVSNDDFIELPLVDFKKANLRKDYVKVCGIKWAKGNLQSKSTFEETGFQPRWRIAPTQWHNFKYASAASSDQTEPVRYDYDNNGDEFEHFNFGGLARNSRFYSDDTNFMKPEAALEISGKIYSNIYGTAEVQGDDRFKSYAADAKADMWGDLAFWASKGKYRMPTNTEMKKFHNVSDKLLGYYVTSDGCKVWGTLLRTPNPTRATNTSYIELTEADLESGVFLPNAGRRANNSSKSVISVTTQGTYRTGSYISSRTVGETLRYYSSYYHHTFEKKDEKISISAKLYDGSLGTMADAQDNAAGFLIRPVLVEE